MFSSINKTLVASAKFLVAATKKLFVVPNFFAVTKPFFSVIDWWFIRVVCGPNYRCGVAESF